MIFCVLFAVVSFAGTRVRCYGYGERSPSGNDYWEAQASREFDDPYLSFPIENFMPFQGPDDYEFDAEHSNVNKNGANNGGFQVPWEEGKRSGDVGDSWKIPFWRHFNTNDFSHDCHHSSEFHRTHSPTFPWRSRAETLKPSIISTTSTTESTTTPMQIKVPNIDIRFGASSENDAK